MRILLVEDEHKLAQSIKKGLEQEKYIVDIAYNGTTGYDYASTSPYDLFILDIMLPGMNGIEICSRLREDNNHTPILILTARSEIEDKVSGLNCGADDYLTKPFAFTELLARINALLRRPHAISETKLNCANLVLNTETFEVTRGKKNIIFSKKEYVLLEYLLRNKNRVVSKETIIDHVWEYDSDVLPNTVEVYIGYLRNKIDKDFKQKLIHTIRGFGYKISDEK